MKKITLLLLLVSTMSYSQIKKVETKKAEKIGKVQFINLEKTGDEYTFYYKDIKFQQLNEYKSFSFVDENNDFENLYSMIKEGMKNMPEEDIVLELPNDTIMLHFEKNFGVASFQFYHYVNKNKDVLGVSRYLTKRQVDKLFGKR